MAQITGTDVVVALYEETEFGQNPAVANGVVLNYKSLGVSATQEVIDNEIIMSGRGVPRSGRGNIDVTGSIVTTLAPQTCGFLLKQIFGEPEDGVYQPKALPPGFIIEKDYTTKLTDGKVERFNGCRVKSAQFTLNQSGYIDVSMDVAGKKYAIVSTPLDTDLTTYDHAGWTGFQATVNKNGEPVGGILSASISIDNEMDTSLYTFASALNEAGQRYALPEGRAKITGSVELVFENFDMIELAQSGDSLSLSWQYTNPDNQSVEFLVSPCEIPLTSPAIETRAGLKVTYNFTAFTGEQGNGLTVTVSDVGVSTWTPRVVSGLTSTLYTTHVGGSVVLAAGATKLLTSSNAGVTWSTPITTGTKNWNGATYDGVKFLLVSGDGYVGIYDPKTSKCTVASTAIASGFDIKDIDCSSKYFVMGGVLSGASKIYRVTLTSSTAATLTTAWTVNAMNTGTGINCITHNNTHFLAVGGGVIAYSTLAGTAFTALTTSSLTGVTLHGVAYCYNRFIAVGSGGAVYTVPSTCTSFTAQTSGISADLKSVIYTKSPVAGTSWNEVVAVGAAGAMFKSADLGETWEALDSDTTNALNAITISGSRCIAVGVVGTIITSGAIA